MALLWIRFTYLKWTIATCDFVSCNDAAIYRVECQMDDIGYKVQLTCHHHAWMMWSIAGADKEKK